MSHSWSRARANRLWLLQAPMTRARRPLEIYLYFHRHLALDSSFDCRVCSCLPIILLTWRKNSSTRRQNQFVCNLLNGLFQFLRLWVEFVAQVLLQFEGVWSLGSQHFSRGAVWPMDLPFGNSVFKGTILMRRMMKERDEREGLDHWHI